MALFCLCVFAVSSLLTFSRVDPLELYRLMGYTEQQLELFKQYEFLQGRNILLWSAAMVIPFLGYVLFVRRHLREPGVSTSAPPLAR